MATQRITTTVTTPSGTVTGASIVSFDATATLDLDTIPASQTSVAYDIAFPYATLKSFVMYSPVACTIKTNASDGTGGNSISLAAGVPLVWDTTSPYSNPFTHDVTKFYVTNSAAGTGFSCKFGYDPTP